MKLPKYDLVFSVGQYCAAAMYMRKHHLRRVAGPLDWIGKPENCLETHFKLICTDFKGFLRKEKLVPHENRRRPEIDDMAHDYYRDGETDIRLFHEFPTGVPVDEAYPAIRKKYDRRIARFYATVASSRRTLFVYHSRSGRLEDRTIIEGMAAVRKRFTGSQIDLLVIERPTQSFYPLCAAGTLTAEEAAAIVVTAHTTTGKPETGWRAVVKADGQLVLRNPKPNGFAVFLR